MIDRLVIFDHLFKRSVQVDNWVKPEFYKLFSSFEESWADDVIFFEFLISILLDVRSEIIDGLIFTFTG